MSRVDARVNTPAEAFDIHTKLIEWRKGHPTEDRLLHHGYFMAELDNANKRHEVLLDGEFSDLVTTLNVTNAVEASNFYSATLRTVDDTILTTSDTVFLSDDVRELVITAEATMPDEVLFDTDIYTPCGFIVMETPIDVDIKSKVVATDIDNVLKVAQRFGSVITGERKNATPNAEGQLVAIEKWQIRGFAWGDIEATRDETLSAIAKKFGTDSDEYEFAVTKYFPTRQVTSKEPVGVQIRVYGSLIGTELDGLHLGMAHVLHNEFKLMDKYDFMYGEDGRKLEIDTYAEMVARTNDEFGKDDINYEMNLSSLERYKQTRRFLAALFRLMNEYVDKDDETLSRPFSRRAVRAGRTGKTSAVTTLSLRRTIYGDSESGTGRKVTLAHLVRGHWRRQWYPSHKTHRAKWINAHRRGGHVDDIAVERPRVIKVIN